MPGHGKVSDRNALSVMKEYFVSMRNATGNPGKLTLVKKKYSDYGSLPFLTGFDRTVTFIESEKNSEVK